MYFVGMLALVVIGYPTAAWAYIDPSAGSIVLQLLLGGLAGAAVLAKLYYRKLFSLFSRRPQSANHSPGEGSDHRK